MSLETSVEPQPDQELQAKFETLRWGYRANRMPSYQERKDALERLMAMVIDHQAAICSAAAQDFGCRPPQVTLLSDVMPTVLRGRYALANLSQWLKPSRAPVNRLLFGLAKNYVLHQPLGVVGIMAPWNFPFDLTLGPLVEALAAGNRALLKPSEHTPASAALLEELVSRTFGPDEVAVVCGGADVAQAFCRLPLDHILFTGGIEVGKKVMAAASSQLTPVTLELGGKCPSIIAPDRMTRQTVTDIMAGKLFNAGQVCIATDYVLVHEEQVETFVALVRTVCAKMYPSILDNPDYTSIVNEAHFQRLMGYLEEARGAGLRIEVLGGSDAEAHARVRKIPPTLVHQPPESMRLMQEEIFGPILPILTYRRLEQALECVNDHPRPLALYLFTDDERLMDRVMTQTISGGACLNSTILHTLQVAMPFGGVGLSGFGEHHGYAGFETFSKRKSVFKQHRYNSSATLHPPYTHLIDRVLELIIR